MLFRQPVNGTRRILGFISGLVLAFMLAFSPTVGAQSEPTMTADPGTVTERDGFDQVFSLTLIDDQFLSTVSAVYVDLGEDFGALSVGEVVYQAADNATVRLTGDLVRSTGQGTITVKAAALAGDDDVTATVTVNRQDLNSGLVLHLDFEDNMDDSSVYGNNGAAIGHYSYVTGVNGKAVQFRGVDNPGCIKVPDSTSLHFDQKLTVSFYARLDNEKGRIGNGSIADKGRHCLFAKNDDSSGHMHSILYPSNKTIAFKSGSSAISANSAYVVGSWMRVTIVVSSDKLVIYENKQKVKEETLSQPWNFSASDGRDLYIGGLGGTYWYPFYGAIDDFRIYNRALSDDEVKQLPYMPAITGVTSDAEDGAYSTGQTIPIRIMFDGPVEVTGTPTLALNSGGTADYVSGSGTDTLVFQYTIQSDNETAYPLDYTGTDALSLGGGTISAGGINAITTLPQPGSAQSLGGSKDIAVNPDSDISRDFIDANFKQAVWEWLGHTGTPGSFTKQDLADRMVSKQYSLYVPYKGIASLAGLEHFKDTGLKNLYCYGNQLSSLPVLPDGLERLDCYNNQLSSLPDLPVSLKYLYCDTNQLSSLPVMPGGLEELGCGNNQLSSLPDLPVSLMYLYCYDNQLSSLPVLPDGLEGLDCGDNQLSSLPELPAGLMCLYCYDNQLSSLPALPEGLDELDCSYNYLNVFSDDSDVKKEIDECNAYKYLTPQYRYTYTGTELQMAMGDSRQIAGSELQKQESSDGITWGAVDDGNPAEFSFASSDSGVAEVDAGGLITAKEVGACNIRTVYGSVYSDYTGMEIPVTVYDTGYLAVTGTEPGNAASNVGIDTDIIITFNRSVQESVYFSDITIASGSGMVDYVSSFDDQKFILHPTGRLAYGTAYTVMIPEKAVQRTDGNELTYDFSFSFTTVSSGNAGLSSLALSEGTLKPVFAPDTTSYSVSVSHSVSSITVTPVTADSNASVVNGQAVVSGHASQPISLSVGSNTITIVVTAQGGTTKTYTITVNRASSGGGGGGGSAAPVNSTSKLIKADIGGSVHFTDATVEVPAGTLPADATIKVARLSAGEANKVVPEGLRVKLGSDVYEIITTGERDFGDKTITIRIAYDPAKIATGELPVIRYYDETVGHWVDLPTTVEQGADGKLYAVTHVSHLTRFAVFSAAVEIEDPARMPVKVIKLTIGRQAATVDGSPYTLDAVPFVDTQTNRTLVPIRFVSEALGAKVDWMAETRQITIKDRGKEIILTLGSKNALVDGQTITIDCAPAVLPPGRTFVPLRCVGETLGATVDYDNKSKQISITR